MNFLAKLSKIILSCGELYPTRHYHINHSSIYPLLSPPTWQITLAVLTGNLLYLMPAEFLKGKHYSVMDVSVHCFLDVIHRAENTRRTTCVRMTFYGNHKDVTLHSHILVMDYASVILQRI